MTDLRADALLVLEHANEDSAAERIAKVWLAENQTDDGELIKPEWLEELGFGDSFNFTYEKRYELCDGVRVMFFACQAPKRWRSELWVGKKITPTELTRGQVRRLCKALGVEAVN